MVRRSHDRCLLRRGSKYGLGRGDGGSRICSGSDNGGNGSGGDAVSVGGGVGDMLADWLVLMLVLGLILVVVLLTLFRHAGGALVLVLCMFLFREPQR